MATTFTFDPENALRPTIKADGPETEFTVQELYSDWMDWLQADPANHSHLPIFADGTGNVAPEGNKSLGGSFSPQFYFMLNGWVFEPQDADGITTIVGNLFADPAKPTREIIQYPVGYDATVKILYSNQAQIDYATLLAEIIAAKQAAQAALATNFV